MNSFPLPRITRLVGLLGLGLGLSLFAGCVSMDDYKKQGAAFDTCRQQLAESENDKANLLKQIEALNARIAEQDALIKAGLGGNALQKQIDLLNAEIARLRAENRRLLDLAGSGPLLPAGTLSALQQLAEKYPDLLEFDERLGMIRFKSDMTFDVGSTDVKPRAREALKILAGILNNAEIANNEIQVVGHTDDIPIRATNAVVMSPTNWYLSTNRAHSVRAVLAEVGVKDVRMEACGWGETRPISPNAAGKKGNEKNRRVEIYIRPTTVPDSAIPGDTRAIRSTPPATPPTRGRSTTPTRGTPPARSSTPPASDVPVPADMPR